MSVRNDILTSRSAETSIALERRDYSRRYLDSSTLTRSARAFLTLAKPEITMMVMISAGVASVMAAGSLQVTILVHTVLGIGLLAAGTSALNQYVEREL